MIELINRFHLTSQNIIAYEEEKVSKVFEPRYCSYFHAQFYGSKFPDVLTRNKNGFLMRRKYELDLPSLTAEFRQIFKDNTIFVDVRESPLKHPNPKYASDNDPWPAHDKGIYNKRDKQT